MSSAPVTTSANGRDLQLNRIIHAARHKVFQAWTDPQLIVKWFAPKPWTTSQAQTDVRPGGSSLIVMRSPDGQEFPNRGVYLEVVKNERLVFTDAYTQAWEPSERPYFTVILTFDEHADGTRYGALLRHWSIADREAHEKMGFHTGWPQCAEQLAQLLE